MLIEPIGFVRSPAQEGVDDGWSGYDAEIEVREELAEGLVGLEAFSHILVVFLMDRATFNSETDLVRHPRGRSDMPLMGIFAQRAKHRPNPIGVTAVQLVAVRRNIITVRGLDAIDGTPVLDIKPYFPQFDRVDASSVPGWVDTLMEGYF